MIRRSLECRQQPRQSSVQRPSSSASVRPRCSRHELVAPLNPTPTAVTHRAWRYPQTGRGDTCSLAVRQTEPPTSVEEPRDRPSAAGSGPHVKDDPCSLLPATSTPLSPVRHSPARRRKPTLARRVGDIIPSVAHGHSDSSLGPAGAIDAGATSTADCSGRGRERTMLSLFVHPVRGASARTTSSGQRALHGPTRPSRRPCGVPTAGAASPRRMCTTTVDASCPIDQSSCRRAAGKPVHPAYRPEAPSSSSIRNSWLYFSTRSIRAGAPVLI